MANTQSVTIKSKMYSAMKTFMLHHWAFLDIPELDGSSDTYEGYNFELIPIVEEGQLEDTSLSGYNHLKLTFRFQPINDDNQLTIDKDKEDYTKGGVAGDGLYFEITRGEEYKMHGLALVYASTDTLDDRQIDFMFYDSDGAEKEPVHFTYGGDLIVTDIQIEVGDD